MEAGGGRHAGSGVRHPGVRVVGRTGRGLVSIPPPAVAAAWSPVGGGVHRLLRQLRRGSLRLAAACRRSCGWRSATRCNVGSTRTGPAPHRDRSSRCWTTCRQPGPSRCWSVRSTTGWPDCRPRPHCTRRARSSVTRSSACSICATGPAGTANTSVTCGCCGGSVSPATTVPDWISLRCNHSGCESWPNDGAAGACRAESGWGSYAVTASRSCGCRSSRPDWRARRGRARSTGRRWRPTWLDWPSRSRTRRPAAPRSAA